MVIDSALGPLAFRGERPETVMHVGASSGQEFGSYQAFGMGRAVYVEPLDEAFALLKKRLSQAETANVHIPVQALCLDRGGRKLRLNISNKDGVASSVLGLGRVRSLHPQIKYVGGQEVVSTTVDTVVEEVLAGHAPELLVIDTQGTELEVLKGSVRSLEGPTRFVFCEVSHKPLYEGGCEEVQVTAFLSRYGFHMVYLLLNHNGWGDALYAKSL